MLAGPWGKPSSDTLPAEEKAVYSLIAPKYFPKLVGFKFKFFLRLLGFAVTMVKIPTICNFKMTYFLSYTPKYQDLLFSAKNSDFGALLMKCKYFCNTSVILL